MLSPECSPFSLGPPLLSTQALSELHALLTSLPIRASLNSPKEGVDETIGKATLMNLPLFDLLATATPDEQQNVLTMARMELLISAAEAESEQPGNGGEDES